MAQASEIELLKRATACPKHGSTHCHRLITPDPGDFFAAYYVCYRCAGAELDRLNAPKTEQQTR